MMPPSRPAGRSDGASASSSVADTRRGGGSVAREVWAARRSRSAAKNPVRVTARLRRGSVVANGSTYGIGRVRCGAVTSMRMPRSTALSWAIATWPLAR